MAISSKLKNQHLLWRAGFGPMAEEFKQLSTASEKSYLQALFKTSSKSPSFIDVADNAFKGLVMGIDGIVKLQKKELTAEDKKKLRQQSKEDIKNLNLAWLDQMVNSDQQLREKVSLFWHGHFACRAINIFYQQQLLDIIRKNALGNFGDLLKEVSKSAAMINFLNNNQNRKGHPNENFAREVMELFTMGRGNYSENDIKEAARAFTGWGATFNGEFVFRKFQHDDGNKTILGRSGNFSGEDVLNILLENKQTAKHITRKVYRFFVNETIDETKVDRLAGRFYQSNYNIRELLHDIFSSDWFYEEKNIGARIKSPVELIVGIRRVLPMKIENEESQLIIQRLLGQVLFYPPNVAGWPGGRNWIDSSSLMLRLRIPQFLYAGNALQVRPKDDDDQMMGMKEPAETNGSKRKGYGKMNNAGIKTQIDWVAYMQKYDGIAREKLLNQISETLLQAPATINEDVLKRYTDASSREEFIKTATIQLMSTPEYQLC